MIFPMERDIDEEKYQPKTSHDDSFMNVFTNNNVVNVEK